MNEQKKEYWINIITEELKRNNEPVWYNGDLIYDLKGHFKILKKDLNNMCLVTFLD